jgi:hypothetical protein
MPRTRIDLNLDPVRATIVGLGVRYRSARRSPRLVGSDHADY